MTPPQGANVCKAGVAYQSTEQSSFRSADGKTVIREESTVTICRQESSVKNNESAAKDSKHLKSLMKSMKHKTASKPKATEGQGGEVNLGMLSFADRAKALNRSLPERPIRSPGETANYQMMDAAKLHGAPKRAAGTPTRATGTPKK